MRKEVVVVAAITAATAAVGAAVLVRQWKRRSERRWRIAQRILRKFARECATPVPKLWHVANDLVSSMEEGLTPYSLSGNTLSMFAVPSDTLPTGDEEGVYYGINFRGTNFLISRARLGGKSEVLSELYREEIAVPSDVINGKTTELAELICLELAKCVSVHTQTSGENQFRERKLGFTITPQVHEAAGPGAAVTKLTASASDSTVAEQLVNEMNQKLEKLGLEMQIPFAVDDASGVLAGGRYYSRECVAAITLGMGTSISYTESAQAAEEWHAQKSKSGELVINMQWRNFNSSRLPITEFDAFLDGRSSDPGIHIFEKLISGMYLGEIVRLVLLKMAQEASVFGDGVPPKLATPYLLRSPDMAAMHQDTTEDYEVIEDKLKEVFAITNTTPQVRELVAEVCDVVAERGARLVGAGIVGIIKKLGRVANKRSVITVDGGLYEHYRVFRNYLHSSVWEMLGSELSDNVIIEPSHGGSGAGAIFLAAALNSTS